MDEMVADKFPAPDASQVCYKEQHGRNPNQPPSLWETKLHVTIVDDSFSFLYSYNMETEFAAFYQNCTTDEKGLSLEVPPRVLFSYSISLVCLQLIICKFFQMLYDEKCCPRVA